MSLTTIQRILNNKIYKDGFELRHTGSCKLNFNSVKEIRTSIKRVVGREVYLGASPREASELRSKMYREIGAQYGMSTDTIRRLYKHQIWKNCE